MWTINIIAFCKYGVNTKYARIKITSLLRVSHDTVKYCYVQVTLYIGKVSCVVLSNVFIHK